MNAFLPLRRNGHFTHLGHVTRRPSGSRKLALWAYFALSAHSFRSVVTKCLFCLLTASFFHGGGCEKYVKIAFFPDWITANTSLCQRSADSRSPRSRRGHDVVSFPESLSYDVRHSKRLEEREEDIILFEVSLASFHGQMFQTCERREH